MIGTASDKLPAHRPSRRHLIVDAAVRVFARQGLADASVLNVADEAKVVPNAIYYHFAGKDELFDAALRQTIEQIDTVTRDALNKAIVGNKNASSAVTVALWDWLEEHPDEGQFLYRCPPGATPKTSALWKEFEDHHVWQDPDRVDGIHGPRTGYSAAANHAAHVFTGRALITLVLMMGPLRVPGGPLAEYSSRTLRTTVNAVAANILSPEPPKTGKGVASNAGRKVRKVRGADGSSTRRGPN